MIKDIKKNILVVKYVFRYCPFYALFTLLFIACNTFMSIQKIFLIGEAVSLVESLINKGLVEYTGFIIIIAKYLGIVIVCTIYTSFYNSYVKGYYRINYIKMMRKEMYKKAKNVDYENFDDPTFYDMYSRAMRDGITRGIRVFEDITTLISSLVNTIAMGTFIVVSNPYLIIIIIVSVIIRLIIGNKVNKNIHSYETEIETSRRMYGYVKRTFYQERFAAEIKCTNVGEILIDNCHKAQDFIDEKCISTYKKNTLLNSISTVITNVLELGLVYVFLVYQLFNGMGIPSFSEIVTATKQFSQNFYSMASFFNKIKMNAMYIDYFIEYMNYKPKLETLGTEELNEELKELTVENVDFKYPANDRLSLSNININIKKGETIAIVGLNGAGKTTLVKLLLKFYNPTSGKVLYNGKDIKDVKENEIRSKYSIVFQDYRIYGVTIGENILMRKVETEEDEKRIWTALEYVGMKEKIENFADGINTMCTREFRTDGAEFSGGELQRLVIARAFASNADIYILDEPTSNLDPLAERRVNQLIIEKASDKAVIIIAHRLSTVVDADRIILIEYGKIIEEGNHEELMRLKGKYFEMFSTQGNLYFNNKV